MKSKPVKWKRGPKLNRRKPVQCSARVRPALLDQMYNALESVWLVRERIVAQHPEYRYEMRQVESAMSAYNELINEKEQV